MSAIVFDGRGFARERERTLVERVRGLGSVTPRIATVVFSEDEGGLLYTRLKKQVAVRVGVEFSEQVASVREDMSTLQQRVRSYCEREDVVGVLIQKPTKQVWQGALGVVGDGRFETWWRGVVSALEPRCDVDCLTQEMLARVYNGDWRILPATVKAVVSILNRGFWDLGWLEGGGGFDLTGRRVVVVGRSDILGKPLAAVLGQYGAQVRLFGRDLDVRVLAEADVVVSGTGIEGLIKGEMVKEGVVVVDVGSPKGDVEFESVREKAALVTPVPGGVGPVTVVSLLENLVELVGR